MPSQFVITIVADDQTGLVEKIANAVTDAGGNWLESSLSQLAGKFAGIALVSVPLENQATLESALSQLASAGIHISMEASASDLQNSDALVILEVVANDRPGIVQEVTRLLASLNINVESFDTTCGAAAMSSGPLFEASAVIALPEGFGEEQLRQPLESLSDDLMVEIHHIEDDEVPEE